MANPQRTAQTIRTAFDVTKALTGTAPQDATTGATIMLATGADLLWQMVFSVGTLADGTIIDPTNLASIVVALQASGTPHEGTTYWSQTVLNANITAPGGGSPALTAANWANGSQQQVNLAVPASVWNTLSVAGSNQFWCCIYGVTNDSTAKYVTLAFFQVSLFDTGIPVTNPLASPSVLGYQSYLCPDGKYRRWALTNAGGGYCPNPDGSTSP